MNKQNEIKVGQVWNDPYFGEIKVIAKENNQVVFQKADGKFIIVDLKSPEWVKYLTLICDAETQLSDLETVQKALVKTGSTLHLYSDGSYQTVGGYFENSESLLTWAKQTIGVE